MFFFSCWYFTDQIYVQWTICDWSGFDKGLIRFSFDFFAIFNVKIFTTAFLKSFISFWRGIDWSLIDCFHKFSLVLLLLWILTFSCISFCLYLFLVFTYCTRVSSRFFSFFLSLWLALHTAFYDIYFSIVKSQTIWSNRGICSQHFVNRFHNFCNAF